MKNKVVRFLIFFLGLSALSLGIALVTARAKARAR